MFVVTVHTYNGYSYISQHCVDSGIHRNYVYVTFSSMVDCSDIHRDYSDSRNCRKIHGDVDNSGVNEDSDESEDWRFFVITVTAIEIFSCRSQHVICSHSVPWLLVAFLIVKPP